MWLSCWYGASGLRSADQLLLSGVFRNPPAKAVARALAGRCARASAAWGEQKRERSVCRDKLREARASSEGTACPHGAAYDPAPSSNLSFFRSLSEMQSRARTASPQLQPSEPTKESLAIMSPLCTCGCRSKESLKPYCSQGTLVGELLLLPGRSHAFMTMMNDVRKLVVVHLPPGSLEQARCGKTVVRHVRLLLHEAFSLES